MSTVDIFAKQEALQKRYASMMNIQDPGVLPGNNAYAAVMYIRAMQGFANDEINEILVEIAGSPQNLKPWTKGWKPAMGAKYTPTDKTRLEAIDFLCFAINICLASGLTPQNVEEFYDVVHKKNVERQNSAVY
jgi:hypothetical protein